MSDFSCITPLILTFNEAPNIQRNLERLTWAKEILILDSFSTDQTLDIAARCGRARILQREFDTFAGQCNFGLRHVRTPWVLSMDADYLVSDALNREIFQLRLDNNVAGYEVPFRYWVQGQPLRGSLYPPRTVLYRRDRAQYLDQGHSHRVRVQGLVRRLSGWMEHDDRKPLERWLQDQARYACREAEYLANTPLEHLNLADRVRRTIMLAPLLVPAYTLLFKRLIFDGWPGCCYAMQRAVAELLLSMQLLDARRRRLVD